MNKLSTQQCIVAALFVTAVIAVGVAFARYPGNVSFSIWQDVIRLEMRQVKTK